MNAADISGNVAALEGREEGPRGRGSRLTVWHKVAALTSAGMLVLAIGFLDLVTGWQMSLFVLYAVPILLVVWYFNLVTALLYALICTVAWWLANGDEHPYVTNWGYLGATFSRLVYFTFVAVGGMALHMRREADRERVMALERARDLEREIVRVSEEEQRRIGRDLHDGLCQFLAGIKCALGVARHDLEVKQHVEHFELRKVEQFLKEAVTQARDLARGISPVMSDEFGLAAALEDLACNSGKLYSQEVQFHTSGNVAVHNTEDAVQLYRIAQEGLSNALRHSGGGIVKLSIKGDKDSIALEVRDEGMGIQFGERPVGMGLRTMEYRAHALRAEFTVNTSPNGGTVVRCHARRRAPVMLAAGK